MRSEAAPFPLRSTGGNNLGLVFFQRGCRIIPGVRSTAPRLGPRRCLGGLVALLVFANAVRGFDEIVGRRTCGHLGYLVKRVKAFGVFHQTLYVGSSERLG